MASMYIFRSNKIAKYKPFDVKNIPHGRYTIIKIEIYTQNCRPFFLVIGNRKIVLKEKIITE